MDSSLPPLYGPVFGIQQHRNLQPVVPCNQEYFKIFLKGHPKVLGTIQITLVLLHLSLGAILSSTTKALNSTTAYSGIPYWATVFYLISGGLCVTAEIKPSHTLVKWTFAFTSISFLISIMEFCLICIDLNNSYACLTFHSCWVLDYLGKPRGIALGFLLFACLMQLGMSAYLLFMSKRALNANEDYMPQVYSVNKYKYSMSFQTSQSANENPNYVPVT